MLVPIGKFKAKPNKVNFFFFYFKNIKTIEYIPKTKSACGVSLSGKGLGETKFCE